MDKHKIADSFSRAAENYDSMAYFQRSVGDDLLSLIPNIKPASILDLGSGTGHFSLKLAEQYPDQYLVSMDLAHGMNRYAKSMMNGILKQTWVTGDAESLAFQGNSFDLIYSNLALQWCEQIETLARQIQHVLSPEGMLWYSTLLPGTLFELETCWKSVDQYQHINNFIAKRDVVSAWEDTGLNVVEVVEKEYQLGFDHPMTLMRELKGIGAHYIDGSNNSGLTGPGRIKALISKYEQFRDNQGQYPATYRVLMLGVSK